MKATRLLSQQHREAEGLFEKLCGEDKVDKGVAEELCRKLLSHMIVEQTIFYPAVAAVDEELVLEGYEEHAVARYEIRRLLDIEDEALFKARATTLKELIEHHVGEEDDELFPAVEKKIDGDQLEALGESMQALFDQLVKRDMQTLLDRSRRTGEDGARTMAA